MNIIPNLSGKICASLIRQDYWYKGEKSKGVHLLFLKVVGGKWHRFFFDYGPLFWREVEKPDAWSTTRDDEFHYEQTEIGLQQGLAGIVIKGITHNESANRHNPELILRFANGTRLILRDFCEHQELRFEMQS